jgi:hypothetical protein
VGKRITFQASGLTLKH